MQHFLIVSSAAIGIAVASLGSSLAATNIVGNPDFANGLNDWTVSGQVLPQYSANNWRLDYTDFPTYDGATHDVGEGCGQGWNCTLSQTLATTPGLTYTLSFAFNPGYCVGTDAAQCDGPDGYNALYGYNGNLTAYFGGNQVATFTDGSEGWTVYSYSVTASSASTVLSFVGYQNPDTNGLNDISVTVPEPSTWAMMLLGFAGLGFAGHRRARAGHAAHAA
jgi:hypothetical protein